MTIYETDTYNTSYDYDTADNLIQITDTLGNVFSFGYDSLGRRVSLTDPDIGTWTYTYDVSGNLVKQEQNGGGNLITGDGYYREYNDLNQLTIIRSGNSASSPQIENYTYDPFGQRVKIERNDSAATVIYTPFKELMRIVNSSGTYDHTYIYQDGSLVARVNPDGSRWFYHSDHLGSTTLITDESGAVVEETFYEPFGEVTSGGDEEVKLYTGQFSDADTEQYYYGARYYKPSWGRFVQADPTIQKIYNPQSLNRYSYVWNNPYKYTDSSGFAVIAVNEIDETEVDMCGTIITVPIERTYIYEDSSIPYSFSKIGYVQSSQLVSYYENGEYKIGRDYTIVMGREIVTSSSSSTYNPSTEFVTTGETKQLATIIQENKQKFWRTETYDRISQGIGITLEVVPFLKYGSTSKDAIDMFSTIETATQIEAGVETVEAAKTGNPLKTIWKTFGLIPGLSLFKEIVEAVTYESPGLSPYEVI